MDGAEGRHIVRTGEREATLVILAPDVETPDRLGTGVGRPWTVEGIVRLLAGPAERRIGPTAAQAL